MELPGIPSREYPAVAPLRLMASAEEDDEDDGEEDDTDDSDDSGIDDGGLMGGDAGVMAGGVDAV